MRGKKQIKKIIAVLTAVIVLAATGISVFAQELPAEEDHAAAVAAEQPAATQLAAEEQPAAEQGQPDAVEQTAAPQPEPAAETPSSEPDEEPSKEPEATETPAAPEKTPAGETVAEEETEPSEAPVPAPAPEPSDAPQLQTPAPAEEGTPEASQPQTPQESQTPVYTAPEIFLSDIVAKGDNDTLTLTEEQLEEIEKNLPEGIGPYRREIVRQAYSLAGKVNYFWGGKSTAIGWDKRWGNDAIVGSAGSTQTGTVRSYGLDCSGYVLWCMLNAEQAYYAGDPEQPVSKTGLLDQIGYGTAGQWRNSYEIAWEDAQPGDIVFYKDPQDLGINHVGILVGTDAEKGTLVAHCSSSKNSVVVTPLEGSGFRYVRRFTYLDSREDGQNERENFEIEVSSAQNGLPLLLTEDQARTGAIQNGWTMD